MRTHELNPISLVFGLAFAALGSTFLFGPTDVGRLHLDRIWPLAVIVMGALIIVLAARRGRTNPPHLPDSGPSSG